MKKKHLAALVNALTPPRCVSRLGLYRRSSRTGGSLCVQAQARGEPMNEYVMYKSQTNFEQELLRLKNSPLPAKAKTQIENFARMRLAKGSGKLRVVKCMYCVRLLAQWLNKDFSKATKTDLIRLVTDIDSKNLSLIHI